MLNDSPVTNKEVMGTYIRPLNAFDGDRLQANMAGTFLGANLKVGA